MYGIVSSVSAHLARHEWFCMSMIHKGLTRKFICSPNNNRYTCLNSAKACIPVETKHLRNFWHLCCSSKCSVEVSVTSPKQQPDNLNTKVSALNETFKFCQMEFCSMSEHGVSDRGPKKRFRPNKINDLQENDKPLSELAKEVFEVMERKKQLKNVKVDQSLIESNMQTLVDIGLVPLKVRNLFMRCIPLSIASEFDGSVKLLCQNGFSMKSIYKMCNIAPTVFNDISQKQMYERIENLRNIGLSQNSILKLLNSKPDVLLLSTTKVLNRIKVLCALFKKEDVCNLCLKSPCVLEDDMSIIQSKFDYVFHVMGITQRQMMYSNLFNHSVRHIESRHNFLVRAGLFKKIKKSSGQKNTNPLLQDILDTNDEEFVRRNGNMSVLDYKVFCALFEKERKGLEQGNSDTDETDDEEDIDIYY